MAFEHWITLEDAELHLLWEAGLIELTSVRRAIDQRPAQVDPLF
jgi:hypothetical protein